MTFAPSQVIPGWTEVPIDEVGDEVELYIPSVGLVILLVVTCRYICDNNIIFDLIGARIWCAWSWWSYPQMLPYFSISNL